MNSAQKPLSILVATLALLFEPAVMAAGLSDIVVHSALGEPLRAEIRLTAATGETFDPSCFRIAPPAAANGDDLPWIRNARISISGDRLRITTREPINHPAAMLGLRVACGTELYRDYPILLQPPMARNATPEISPPTADVAPSPRTGGTRARKPFRTAATAVGEREERVVPPKAGVGNKTGRKGADKKRRGDRLVISKDKNPALRLDYRLPHPPAAAESAQATPTGKSTLSTYDESISAQLELDEKIRRLEEYQAALRQRIAELDRQEADVQRPAPLPEQAPAAPTIAAAPPHPTPPAAAPEESSPKGAAPDWLAVLGGITAVAAGGLALLWMRKRRSDAAPLTEFEAARPHESVFPDEPVVDSSAAAAAAPPPVVPATPLAPPPPQSYAPPPIPDDSADWAEPTFAPAHPIPFDETVDEQDSALELAEIMMSFGRTQGAAETLADYIRSNPRQAVKPWLKLLDVYHVAGMRAEFEALTRQLNKTFNVKTITWADFKASRAAPDSVEQMEHVMHQLQERWGTQEAQVYIHQLLRDNRNGTRQGFPLSVVEELLLLLAVLDDTLGTYRPNVELTLADLEPPRPGSKAAA
ncbi:FimV family protein [Zoogloea sp. LCSB751]|uniref:type IV pilus assembly protein FimV n=1 Tax=Zoogloea sp. LCSB751 TaxID=1965277 RepID=UPI0009A48F2A|nr:hypothetical protein [Zoogloea sp. LCSB751]